MDEFKLRQRADIDVLVHALNAIATESTDVDSTRIALVALYETEPGRAFLVANPVGL